MASIEDIVIEQIGSTLKAQLHDKQLIKEGKLLNIENIPSKIVVKTSNKLRVIAQKSKKVQRVIPLNHKYSKPIKGLRFN